MEESREAPDLGVKLLELPALEQRLENGKSETKNWDYFTEEMG